MMIHEVTAKAGAYKARKRVGRGEGGGRGKTSGRGNKGAGSRSGTARRAAFEGGQMPLFRRIRKFGFSNAAFSVDFWIVNLADIVAHPMFAKGGKVDTAHLIKAGLIRDDSRNLKILGELPEGGLKVKLDVVANRCSAGARKAITAAGGSVNETGTRRDKVRGVDRNSDDKSPKNLTKKLKRTKTNKGVKADEEAKAGKAEKPAKPA
jgi:large subunit ribosomal protein L15